MHIQTSHQIIGFGDDRMHLCDSATGDTLVSADRSDGQWLITAPGREIKDTVVSSKRDAIDAMVDYAEKVTGGGCSVAWHNALLETV